MKTKIELLSTPVWSLKDLMEYLGVKSKTTGIKIKERAFKEHNGAVPYGSRYVKRDAILALLGTNAKKELEIIYDEELHQRAL
jgi:hypothetical protein